MVVIDCANPLTSAASSLMLSTIGAMRPRGLKERVPSGVRAVGEVVETRLGKICSTSWAMKPNSVVVPWEGSIG